MRSHIEYDYDEGDVAKSDDSSRDMHLPRNAFQVGWSSYLCMPIRPLDLHEFVAREWKILVQ